MGFLARLHEHRRTVASVTTVSVFSTALVGMAFLYEGEATADVDLNDSGVWVTKTSAGLLGRFNSASQAVDGTLNAGSASFDVQQDAGRVLLEDSGTGTASPVSVAHLKLDGQTITLLGGLEETVTGIEPGQHVIEAEFVAADHGPFDPRVLSQVTFEAR